MFVAPLGKNTVFPLKKKRIGLRDIRDGATNTIMMVEADDAHAVIWSKPDDLDINLKKPLDGLAVRPPGAFLTLFADGSVRFFQKEIDKDKLAALFTRSGGETVAFRAEDRVVLASSRRRRSYWGVPEETIRQFALGDVLTNGVGNQISMHVYDTSPTFDFNLTGFLGEMLGSFRGRRGFGDEMIPISFLIASLNSPVYIAVPVRDAEIVDNFLEHLDSALATLARQRERGGWFNVDFDFYRVPLETNDDRVRCYSVAFGPVKWRMFFARIDDALYVARKRFILDDLAAAAKEEKTDAGPAAHAMVRVRPEHWDKVLPAFRLGWAETSREACLHNLGPLSSVARAMAASTGGKVDARQVHREADRLHAVHFFCPDGGRYERSPDGKQMICSVHGTAAAPRQRPAPAPNSPMGRLMQEFSGLRAQLIFLDDGLHTVVTVERRK